jgi:uncharacterized membrane protein YfcA
MAEVPALWTYLLLTLLGAVVGTYGTLIGAGGGIVLVPALLLLYPLEPASSIASVSLAVVFFNTVSGTIAYGHMHRIDYRAGFLFAAAAAPGGILGAYATSLLSRRTFDLLFGTLVLTLAAFILARPSPRHRSLRARRHHTTHTLTDFKGNSYSYTFSNRRGILFSFAIGFISSMLGMGGGAFYVPVMVYLLHFPLLIATATSQLMLMIISPILSSAHVMAGSLSHGLVRTLFLGLGVIGGAQLGAHLSQRLTGVVISRVLAGGLVVIGLRLAVHAFEQ